MVDTGHEYQHLFDIYVPIAGAVFAIVLSFVVFAVARYRHRPGRLPRGRSERPVLEGAYALALAGVVAILLYFTFKTESKVDALPKHPGLVVDVTAGQWDWRFSYPKYGISQFSSSAKQGTLYVPSGTPVLFRLRSVDVIHSFWIPKTRFKKDVFPGAVNEAGLLFRNPGYLGFGECAEYCGLHHADMSFGVQVLAPPRFDAWARSRQKAAG